jgi:hypothetical protein
MSTSPLSGSDWVQAAFPLVGPFDAEHLVRACDALIELVRYVAHATYPVRDSLRYAPDVYAVLGRLSQAVHSLHQVCEQIGHRLEGLAADPRRRPNWPSGGPTCWPARSRRVGRWPPVWMPRSPRPGGFTTRTRPAGVSGDDHD